jgi:anti-sigma factor RsiW
MRFFSSDCARAPDVAIVGDLEPHERLALEAHARACASCDDDLRAALAVDAALRRAFAPLQSRRTSLAPGRARLALGPRRGAPRSFWGRTPALFARLAKVSVAFGVTLFALTGSIEEPRSVHQAPHSVISDYFRSRPPASDDVVYFRWLRLQPPPASAPAATTRLPAGGRYDFDVAEVVTSPSAAPR